MPGTGDSVLVPHRTTVVLRPFVTIRRAPRRCSSGGGRSFELEFRLSKEIWLRDQDRCAGGVPVTYASIDLSSARDYIIHIEQI